MHLSLDTIDIYSLRAPVSWLTTVSLILEILVVKDYFILADDLAIVSWEELLSLWGIARTNNTSINAFTSWEEDE